MSGVHKQSVTLRCFTAKSSRIESELVSSVGIALPGESLKDKALSWKGLWDTGATGCAITRTVADNIGASPIGVVQVGGVHGVEEVNLYVIDIYLPNNVVIPEVDATELSETAGCDLLIGMDVIGMGDFSVSNADGKTFFSFRVPSVEDADFTTVPPRGFQARNNNKAGRNDLCPCGSGNKYKKCCGK